MNGKVSEAEMIRRLKQVAAVEDKYFPGVLGNPVTFAGRWGLPLSKDYSDFKAKQGRAKKPRSGKSKTSKRNRRPLAKQ